MIDIPQQISQELNSLCIQINKLIGTFDVPHLLHKNKTTISYFKFYMYHFIICCF